MEVNLEEIIQASKRFNGLVKHTPLELNMNLSEEYGCEVYLKREDLQLVRSYKIRGAYNLISSLNPEEKNKGVVCASAGNHAQGVALTCNHLKIPGTIFMPKTTPRQKIEMTRKFGNSSVEIVLIGDSFDDACKEAVEYSKRYEKTFVHPFNDERIICGQGTVGLEIMNDLKVNLDYIFVPIGGGGLVSGVGSVVKSISPLTKVIGVEPKGATSMYESFKQGRVVELNKIDKFVDGAAVKKVGDLTYRIAKNVVDEILLVPEGEVCHRILKLYTNDAIVAEPAGALSIASLEQARDRIKSKKVVCILSGGNNDIDRLPEIKERALVYRGLKHYFIIRFPQRAGALKEFVNKVLCNGEDITRFEYMKKHDKENGPALVGIELKDREDFKPLVERMTSHGINYSKLDAEGDLYDLLI